MLCRSANVKVVMNNKKLVVGRVVQGMKDQFTDNLSLQDDRVSRGTLVSIRCM